MKFLKHSLITFLSLMVFITSSGLTVNLHYCADELQKVSLKKENSSCMMEKVISKKSCETSNTSVKKVDTCCKDKKIQAKSQTKISDTKAKEQGFFLTTITFIRSYFTSLFSFESSDEEQDKENQDTLFPLLKKGLYILLQQFRN